MVDTYIHHVLQLTDLTAVTAIPQCIPALKMQRQVRLASLVRVFLNY